MAQALQYLDVSEGKMRAISDLDQDDVLVRMNGISPELLERAARALGRVKVTREQHRIDAMMDAYLDTDAFDQVEAQIDDDNAWLRSEFVKDFEMLTSTQIHERSGSQSRNKAVTASDWKKSKKIFSVKMQGKELFPAFQFSSDGRPFPLMNAILRTLENELSSWQIAFWLISPQNNLDGRLPIDLVRNNDSAVILAAETAYELPAG